MIYTITIQLKDPRADLLAVKEALAYYCERYGDLTLVSVTAQQPKQETIFTKGAVK